MTTKIKLINVSIDSCNYLVTECVCVCVLIHLRSTLLANFKYMI